MNFIMASFQMHIKVLFVLFYVIVDDTDEKLNPNSNTKELLVYFWLVLYKVTP